MNRAASARGGARGRWIALWVAAAFTGVALYACSGRRDPIVLDEGTLVVENQSKSEWRNVVVTVNDHFRGGTPVLAAGARMTAPLTQFQTAFGQKYSRQTQSVYKVEVTATDASGAPVKLQWNGQRIPH
jgi:hypothetical protein